MPDPHIEIEVFDRAWEMEEKISLAWGPSQKKKKKISPLRVRCQEKFFTQLMRKKVSHRNFGTIFFRGGFFSHIGGKEIGLIRPRFWNVA